MIAASQLTILVSAVALICAVSMMLHLRGDAKARCGARAACGRTLFRAEERRAMTMGSIVFDALSDIVLNIVDMIFSRKTSARESRKGAGHDGER